MCACVYIGVCVWTCVRACALVEVHRTPLIGPANNFSQDSGTHETSVSGQRSSFSVHHPNMQSYPRIQPGEAVKVSEGQLAGFGSSRVDVCVCVVVCVLVCVSMCVCVCA